MLFNEERAYRVMEKHGVEVLIASSPENVTYVTDFWSLSHWLLKGTQTYAVFPRNKKIRPYIVTPISELDQAAIEESCWIKEFVTFGTFYYESPAGAPYSELEKKMADLLSASKHKTDAMTALIGGVPLCHGCGGLTAHYRLGARTGGAPLMLGGLFLLLGLFGGGVSMNIFRLIPFPVLGVLLAYVGFQHMLLAHDLRGWRAWLTALLVLTLAIWTGNLAIGFVSAAVFYHLWGWLSPRLSSHA